VKRSSQRLAAVTVIAAVALAACGGDDESSTTDAPAATTPAPAATAPGATTPGPAPAAGELAAGDVFVTGSSTVEPISIKVGELAKTMSNDTLKVTVEGPGTGDGFKKFCAGEADIADASRTIKDEEAAACADSGIEYIELEVGIDGLTVATNKDNTAVTCLDVPALYALIGPESEGFTSWADANALATELGSTSVPLPDAPLDITGPGEESGTYDSFVEFAIKKIATDRGVDVTARADYTSSANDNLIVQGIEDSATSLGWVGYAYYVAEEARMQAIEIDGGDGCVGPTAETIADGTYPFSRSLYIYVNKAKAAENPAVASFVDLYLGEGIKSVIEAGYIAIPADRLAAGQAAWAAR
jgi:phosphate transport system substrate-binding protein